MCVNGLWHVKEAQDTCSNVSDEESVTDGEECSSGIDGKNKVLETV